jgi:uncharacterized protein (DUF488 family)
MTSEALEIWTIGHSNRPIEEFVGILQLHQIQMLADVRIVPASKRFPHFGQSRLARALARMQIGYVHIPSLGGHRTPRPDSPNTAWKSDMFRGYADYMMTQNFARGVEDLLAVARENRTAIMCAEALWSHCHRSLISDHLKVMGLTVRHITGRTKTELHPFTTPARILNDRLCYRPEAVPLELPF